MFEHHESKGIRPQPVTPEDQPQAPGDAAPSCPRQERVRHLLYGSLAGLDRIITILHLLGYANPNDWREPVPVQSSGAEFRMSSGAETWIVIMTKILRLEQTTVYPISIGAKQPGLGILLKNEKRRQKNEMKALYAEVSAIYC